MQIRPMETEADYRAAQAAIDALLDAEAGTPETDRLEVLSRLAEAWEEAHYPVGYPDAIEAILFHMEQNELGDKDLDTTGRGWRGTSVENGP